MSRPELRRRDRRRRTERRVVAFVAAVLLFAIGVAIGEALNDHPRRGGSRIFVRTLQPSTLPPVRETVTVTTP